MNNDELIDDLEGRLSILKKTPAMLKAGPAEVLLEKMLYVVRRLSNEIEALKNGN